MKTIWVLTVVLSAGCVRAQAKIVPDGPPLDVPLPPARVIVAAEEPVPPPPEEPVAVAPAPPKPVPPVVKPVPRPEPKPEAQVEAPPPKPAEPRTLGTPGREQPQERDIRAQLSGASRALSRVNYVRLTGDGKAQYDQSKRFIEQAEQALKERNLVFAATLAEKAATLAAELVR